MIRIKGLTKKYGNKKVLENINLDLKKGKRYGVIGVNGAGKTTLLNCITKIIVNYDGTIKGLEDFGYQPQTSALDPDAKVKNEIRFLAKLKGLTYKEVKDVFKLLKIDFENEKIKNLSNGMKRKVDIAQALLGKPKVLILDEPTAGLDPKAIVEIRNIIKEIDVETLIMTSHITKDISSICDEIILIEKDGVLNKKRDVKSKNIVKLVFKKQPSKKDINLIKKMKHVNDLKIVNNEVFIHFSNESFIKSDVSKLLGEEINVDSVHYGGELDDEFV